MSIKKFIEYIFDKQGLLIIPKWRLNDFLQTRRLKRIISEYCIIDVGANIGQYSKLLRIQVGYSDLIISFESDHTETN